MVRQMMLCAGVLALLAACGDSDTAEERFLEHYQDSLEEAQEVADRLERVQERRHQQIEENDPR